MPTKPLKHLQDEVENSTNFYAAHLAEVDKTNAVISTEEITNEENIPLVKKGTRITKDIAKRLLKHKLSKPIESQIQVEHCLEKEALYHQFIRILEKYPDLKQLHENSGYQDQFKILVTTYIISPQVTQKLTIFAQQLPNEFDKTLFCTLIAINIAHAAKLAKEELVTTYLAGLTHDLGLLHLSPDIFTREDKLTSDEWRSIQTHVVTGYLFIDSLGMEYKSVAKAVLEHHERCDGTGYPSAKSDNQLGMVGQIIGMADSLQAIRVNQFEDIGRNLRYTLPFLKMNFTTYSECVYRATVAVITLLPEEHSPISSFETHKELVKHLITRGNQLSNASVIVRLLYHLSGELHLKKDGLMMIRVIAPFDKMIRQSGLIEEHIIKWLEHVINTDDYNPLKELCELELMQNELYWQLKKVRTSYTHFLEQEPNAGPDDLMRHLLKISAEIDDFL